MKKLQKEYNDWLKSNLPAHWVADDNIDKDADSLMAMISFEDEEWTPTQEQYAWLADFCKRWDEVENS